VTHPRRGEIYLVSFDATVGHEIRKTRPAVVIQNNVSNRYSPITIVAAISSRGVSGTGYETPKLAWLWRPLSSLTVETGFMG
jgi:mRNA-degrading endonuclease toxin of MazEF toxin-antitoxin module